MTNHTPGPWETRYESPGSPWMAIVSPARRRETDAEHRVCELRLADPEHAANARLIAAAPALLASLQACLSQLKGWVDGVSADEKDFVACKQAAAAIEAATGREVKQ